MIEPKVWLPQMVSYCEFIANDDAVKRAWINADLTKTSVSNFDELYEQIFDDLDSDNFDFESSGIDSAVVIEIKKFIRCLHDANEAFGDNSNPSEIIGSKQWDELKRSASMVLTTSAA